MIELSFPIAVEKLQKWMPHRAPMLWIDEVVSVDAHQGQCRIQLRQDALYMSAGQLRVSSFIEWMAQSFGFVRIAQSLCHCKLEEPRPSLMPLTQAYLVAIKNANFQINSSSGLSLDQLLPGTSLLIQIHNIREVGPITLFDSTITLETGGVDSGQVLASASLRVYSV